MCPSRLTLVSILLCCAAAAFATTPVVTVKFPANGSKVGSRVNYVASASSSACAKGIAAMRIYTTPGVNAYTINAKALNTNINLPIGSYSTVVQAWDNCGGVGKTSVNITVSKIHLPPPRFLYATEFAAGRIAEYVVNPLTGSISPTSQGSTWAHWGPVDIASNLGGSQLYVANQGSHDVDAYSIDRTTGNLTEVPGACPSSWTESIDPSGKFIYVADNQFNDFSIFKLNRSTGVPTFVGAETPGVNIQAGICVPYTVNVDPSGTFVYNLGVTGNDGCTVPGGNALLGFSINQGNGSLIYVPGSPFPNSSVHTTNDSDEKVLVTR